MATLEILGLDCISLAFNLIPMKKEKGGEKATHTHKGSRVKNVSVTVFSRLRRLSMSRL
jgi:hypothetical protein